MSLRQLCAGVVAVLSLLPAIAGAQSVRGRLLDGSTHAPIAGALVELRDGATVLVQTVTTPAGNFMLMAPRADRFLLRVAAIGYTRLEPMDVTVGAGGVVVPDIVMTTMVVTLPEITALGGRRICPKSGLSDDAFGRLLAGAQEAMQVMDATVESRQITFDVRVVRTKTPATGRNKVTADTTMLPMREWPAQSIDPDSLRANGFARPMRPSEGNGWMYYSPDMRVLFADWFLESHCYTLMRGKADDTALHLKFEPAQTQRTSKVDISGELTLDRQTLALERLSFHDRNLPPSFPDDAAGGEMAFAHVDAGVWLPVEWAIWAPIAQVQRAIARPTLSGGNASRTVVVLPNPAATAVLGQLETKGQLVKVTPVLGQPQ